MRRGELPRHQLTPGAHPDRMRSLSPCGFRLLCSTRWRDCPWRSGCSPCRSRVWLRW